MKKLVFAVLLTLLLGSQAVADGSDPMPLCRGKKCKPPGQVQL